MTFDLRYIGRDIAGPFIKANHYSHTVPTSDNIFFGCYVDDELFAVVNYGRIASRTEPSVILKRDDATRTNTLELRRLCRLGARGAQHPVKLSAVLAACHDMLRKRGFHYILSYSDQAYSTFKTHGKNGTVRESKIKSGGIYFHSGFTHIGETPKEWHCEDRLGQRVHRSKAYRRMLAHNLKVCRDREITVAQKPTGNKDREWPTDPALWARDDEALPKDRLWTLEQVRRDMGLTRVECPPKDKWLLTL